MRLIIALAISSLMAVLYTKFSVAVFDAPIKHPLILGVWGVGSLSIIILSTWVLVCGFDKG